MTLFQRIEHVKKVWMLLLPEHAAPDQQALTRWSAISSASELEFAIGRTATKSHRCPEKHAPELHNFCGGVLNNERLAKAVRA